MSAETIANVIALAGVMVTFGGLMFAGFAWVVRRMDSGFAREREVTNARFDQVDKRFDGFDKRLDRVDKRLDRVEDRLDKVETAMSDLRAELSEVKVSVARLEGPIPKFQYRH